MKNIILKNIPQHNIKIRVNDGCYLIVFKGSEIPCQENFVLHEWCNNFSNVFDVRLSKTENFLNTKNPMAR